MFELNDWLYTKNAKNLSGELISRENEVGTQLLLARQTIRHWVQKTTKENYQGDKWGIPDVKRDIMDVFTRLTRCLASIPVDKIFAIYGLMQRLGVQLPKPDYALDCDVVYWKACVALMRHQKSIRLLELVNGLPWRGSIPSWVPDFNHTMARWEMNFKRFGASEETKGPRELSADGSNGMFELKSEDLILVTKAKIVGVVEGRIFQHVRPNESRISDMDRDLRWLIDTVHVLQSWIQAALKLSPTQMLHPSDHPAPDAITCVICQIPGIASRIEVQQQTEIIQLLWMACEDGIGQDSFDSLYRLAMKSSFIRRLFLETPGLRNLAYLPEVKLVLMIVSLGLAETFDRLCSMAVGNAFFWTRNGHIGTAPLAVSKGDLVALIPGVRAPMMLRQIDSISYQVIGPAFVYGMMDGEMWTDKIGGRKREEDSREPRDDLKDIHLV
jgi:hypothetical protein